MNVALINPLFAASQEICEGILKVPVTAGKPRLLRDDERLWKFFQISALIQLSEAVQGIAAISFSERVALSMASAQAGELFLSISDDCKNALGEIANQIVGHARRKLPEGLVMSPPKLAQTSMLEFTSAAPTILVQFDASMGRFAFHVTFKPTRKRGAKGAALAAAK